MKIEIDITEGNDGRIPTKEGVQRNIDAVEFAINSNLPIWTLSLLVDTKYILIGIQKQLGV